ncbi:MAG TPA: 1-deoxy-D-xylulose-5-phosphate reductoisomerase [Chthoniobacterales bacterium]|jgi:1-deoxy-D-xylulose-5-phosphate reductoisomerase|nr:1-deoxy-D-xylulose-5-phosphate reductoisomerase [Chthoniobacterales bacterium]
MRKRRIILLGSTGSIGASAIKVATTMPDRMEIVGMAAHRSAQKLAEAANRLKPEALCLVDPGSLNELRAALTYRPEIFTGEEGLVQLSTLPGADMVLVAIVGTAGLRPALAAIDSGKDLAIASKEILVMAGEIVMSHARNKNVSILPVDSEHNAIFQCLEAKRNQDIQNLILTASGGPFRQLPAEQLKNVTKLDALRHPTWKMGQKITIDSATLFNKGLEMIEARWLFNVPMSRVQVIVHPQSIVHSMVEFVDGSILAQLSHSDMCFPIQYAVTWPDRVPTSLRPLRLAEVRKLEFEEPRYDDFPALNLAREAGEVGGVLPAILNAANEVAVQAFLDDRIPFTAIWDLVQNAMKKHPNLARPSLDDILQADKEARTFVLESLV